MPANLAKNCLSNGLQEAVFLGERTLNHVITEKKAQQLVLQIHRELRLMMTQA